MRVMVRMWCVCMSRCACVCIVCMCVHGVYVCVCTSVYVASMATAGECRSLSSTRCMQEYCGLLEGCLK